MPNYVTNVLHAPTHVLKSIEGVDHEGKPYMDFELVIPRPIPTCEHGHQVDVEKYRVEGEMIIHWAEWSKQNWGTGRPAFNCSFDYGQGLARFHTAWTHPWPIISALSLRFPTDELRVSFADEDLGHNYGTYQIINGLILAPTDYEHLGKGTPTATDFACRLVHGCDYSELEAE